MNFQRSCLKLIKHFSFHCKKIRSTETNCIYISESFQDLSPLKIGNYS